MRFKVKPHEVIGNLWVSTGNGDFMHKCGSSNSMWTESECIRHHST